VKSGGRYVSAIEREVLQGVPRPANAAVEIWRFPTYTRQPLIETL
jgi:hypothetical protein